MGIIKREGVKKFMKENEQNLNKETSAKRKDEETPTVELVTNNQPAIQCFPRNPCAPTCGPNCVPVCRPVCWPCPPNR